MNFHATCDVASCLYWTIHIKVLFKIKYGHRKFFCPSMWPQNNSCPILQQHEPAYLVSLVPNAKRCCRKTNRNYALPHLDMKHSNRMDTDTGKNVTAYIISKLSSYVY
jgi:hypothetical protein